MPASQKEVIYVDVDDEITAIIEKLQESSGKIVALVLPKRAAAFQSIVNMKLLKRTADSSKKSIVLITSEKSLLPLAGAVGLHVANTLQSKPAVPSAPAPVSTSPVSVDEIEIGEADTAVAPAAAATRPVINDEETIELDDEPVLKRKGKQSAAAAGGTVGAKKFNKKLKVPDFNSFRTKLLIGCGVFILLIILFIIANKVLPHATVAIKTNSTQVPASVTITTSPAIKAVDLDAGDVPGAIKEYKKTEVQKVAATGQKDMGTKATGTISVTNCTDNTVSVPAGTTFTNSGTNFVTNKDVNVPPSDFFSNGNCKKNKSSDVGVTAAEAGDKYNFSAGRTYTTSFANTISGTGGAMSGGTSKLVKVVSQQDIDNLKNKIVDSVNATANEETKKLLESENYFAITDTFTSKDPVVTSNPGVNAEADEVTVSVTLTYTMIGAHKQGLEEVLDKTLEKKIDTNQQKILDSGLMAAATRLLNKQDNGTASFELDVTATAGVEQNVDDIRSSVAGKKKSEAESAIRSREGVEEVTVTYGPFWVSKVPDNPSKIKVEFDNKSSDSRNE